MASERAEGLAVDTVVHRIGGAQVANLRLKPKEQALEPPGISVFLGGTPQEAAAQMRRAFPDPNKYRRLHEQSTTVGAATLQAIRAAGFDVIPDPTARFPNHAAWFINARHRVTRLWDGLPWPSLRHRTAKEGRPTMVLPGLEPGQPCPVDPPARSWGIYG